MTTKTYRIIFPLLFLTLVLVPFFQAKAQPEIFSPNQTALELIEKVNGLRASKGLSPYEPNTILMQIAQTHANYISSTGVMTHFDDKGWRPYQRALDAGYQVAGNLSTGGLFSESLFSGANVTDENALTVWQTNETDSLALLSSDFKDAGVAIVAANGTTYYVFVAGAQGDNTTEVPTESSKAAGTRVATTGTVIPNTPLGNGEIYHVVQKNEALWSIAIAYGTTIDELKLLNNLPSDEIFEGQKLLVRRASTETPTPTSVPMTATLGLATSTATLPVPPTLTLTPTPVPTPPTSFKSGGMVVGGIVAVALLAAGLLAFLGNRKNKSDV